jgi:transposase
LLERLRALQEDILRFMGDEKIRFINNQGENDICMTKVNQKRTACFRSMSGALLFCLIRSYISTC